MIKILKKNLDHACNLIYPRHCPCCHEILKDQKSLLCPSCQSSLAPITGPRCMKCGKPVETEEEYCRECSQRTRMFTQGKGIFLYNDSWKLSLEKYKYYGCREYGDFYGAAITFYARKELERWQPDLIVPVPLHKKKERMRGFNQALYIAQQISRRTGIPVARDLVIKTKITKSQKKLSADQRRQNLKGAFKVTRSLNGKDVLVIDDVYTTGSTMDAMASCLRQNGAKNVYFLTVCMGFQ